LASLLLIVAAGSAAAGFGMGRVVSARVRSLMLLGGAEAVVLALLLRWLALGWAGHVAWDVGLHGGPGTDFVPAWYLPFSVGFDLIVGGYALGLALAPAALRGESAGPTTL
jgi:hypothetical protein